MEKNQVKAMAIIEKAYSQLVNRISENDLDALQDVTEKVINLLHTQADKAQAWEYQSPENMVCYMKGSIKKRLINITQEKESQLLSYETITENSQGIEHIETKPDLFRSILDAKNKAGKEVFTDTQKTLIDDYYILEKTFDEIGLKQGVTRQAIIKKIKIINTLIAAMPIREIYNDTFRLEITSPYRHDYNYITGQTVYDIIEPANISLLKKYKRTKEEKYLDQWQEASAHIQARHLKKGADSNVKTLPVNTPLNNGKPKRYKKASYGKFFHPDIITQSVGIRPDMLPA
jgi:ribosomal protein L20A (L18A)